MRKASLTKYTVILLMGIWAIMGGATTIKKVFASNVAITGYQNQSDQAFLASDIQIEIFAENDDYFSQRMIDLFVPNLSDLDGKGVSIRMYDVNESSVHQYLTNLITFFNPITPDYLDNPVIVINNDKIITGYTDLNNDEIISLIHELFQGNSLPSLQGVGVYDLKTTEYEPNMYYSLQTNQVEPKRPNEVWYEQLPTFIFLDVEGFEKVSDSTWVQSKRHLEVFVDESCRDCDVLLNQSLLELVPMLPEIEGVIRIYNLNHEAVQAYLEEYMTYFNVQMVNKNEPIVIVNREKLITGYNLKRPKTYQDVIIKLLEGETKLPDLEGITLSNVLPERASDAQTIYFSEGLSKLAHQISQDPIDLPVQHPVIEDLDSGDSISTISFSKVKLSLVLVISIISFILAESYIRIKKEKLKHEKQKSNEEKYL